MSALIPIGHDELSFGVGVSAVAFTPPADATHVQVLFGTDASTSWWYVVTIGGSTYSFQIALANGALIWSHFGPAPIPLAGAAVTAHQIARSQTANQQRASVVYLRSVPR